MHRYSSGNKAVVLYIASIQKRTRSIVDAVASGMSGHQQLPLPVPYRSSMDEKRPLHRLSLDRKHQQQQQQDEDQQQQYGVPAGPVQLERMSRLL